MNNDLNINIFNFTNLLNMLVEKYNTILPISVGYLVFKDIYKNLKDQYTTYMGEVLLKNQLVQTEEEKTSISLD